MQDTKPQSDPKITVLMAVYNGAKYIRESVESILGQTFTDFEFLIVDDGSSDETVEIVESYNDPRIRLIKNPENRGQTYSLNLGLTLAKAPLVARQDADDISHPDRLRKQFDYLETHPETVLLGAQARVIDPEGKPLRGTVPKKPLSPLSFSWVFMRYSPLVHSTAFFRLEVIRDRLGGYDEAFPKLDDFELWSRASEIATVENLPDELLDFRIHPESVTAGYTREDAMHHKQVVLRNMRRVLHDPTIPEEWAYLVAWSTIGRMGWSIENEQALARVLRSLWERFIRVYKDAPHDKELRYHFAVDQVRIVLCLATRARMASLGTLAWTFRTNPGAGFRTLPKWLALSLLGERLPYMIRNRFRRLLPF